MIKFNNKSPVCDHGRPNLIFEALKQDAAQRLSSKV